MKEVINWLHISDLHLKVGLSEWSQDVVLTTLLDDIGNRTSIKGQIDFIVITGDLAFSGKPAEYALVSDLINELALRTDVPKDFIFCVPGNHDIDRSVQRYQFSGVRHELNSVPAIDRFLGDASELSQLQTRYQAYNEFCEENFDESRLARSPDQLGYVASIEFNGFKLAILGFNSAWLSEGGEEERGKLVIGERQVRNVLELIKEDSHGLVIGLLHHPFDWLVDYDKAPVERLISDACDFVHRGHLHQSESRVVQLSATPCHVIAAGAAYETREHQNSYSVVRLSIADSSFSVTEYSYKSVLGSFQEQEAVTKPITVGRRDAVDPNNVARTLVGRYPNLSGAKHYLASLLTGIKEEVLITFSNDEPVFGMYSVLREIGPPELIGMTEQFLSVTSLLRVYSTVLGEKEVLSRAQERIDPYCCEVDRLMANNSGFRDRIQQMNKDAESLCAGRSEGLFLYSTRLMDELFADNDWDQLRPLTERYISIEDAETRRRARLYWLHCIVNCGDEEDLRAGETLCAEELGAGAATADLYALSIRLNLTLDNPDAARIQILDAATAYPESPIISELINEYVIQTGDRELRDALSERRK
ncbi:MAG: metallophosphoesterase [Pseudomonadota bacterium]